MISRTDLPNEPLSVVLDELSTVGIAPSRHVGVYEVNSPANALPEANMEFDDLTQRMRLINEFWHRVAEAKRVREERDNPGS